MTIRNIELRNKAELNDVRSAIAFTGAQIRAGLNDLRSFITTLFTPLLLLVIFWVIGRPEKPGDFDLVNFIFPGIIGLTAMLGGQTIALKLTQWKKQQIFQRLACTPTPVGILILGAGLAQLVLSLCQAILVMLFGWMIFRLPVDNAGVILVPIVLMLGAACFIAFGMLLAGFTNNTEAASSIYLMVILPMFFLGGGFPSDILPAFLQSVSPWLPTSMLHNLLSSLLGGNGFPPHTFDSVGGLLAYTAILTLITVVNRRWE